MTKNDTSDVSCPQSNLKKFTNQEILLARLLPQIALKQLVQLSTLMHIYATIKKSTESDYTNPKQTCRAISRFRLSTASTLNYMLTGQNIIIIGETKPYLFPNILKTMFLSLHLISKLFLHSSHCIFNKHTTFALFPK